VVEQRAAVASRPQVMIFRMVGERAHTPAGHAALR